LILRRIEIKKLDKTYQIR